MDRTEFRELSRRARDIAKRAHSGQVDKAGKPYMRHIKTVTRMVKTPEQKITALLHDVCEDSDITLDDLKSAGFPPEIIHAVDAVTKRKDERYRDYLARIKADTAAIAVKIADAAHNGDLRRIKYPTGADIIRCERYRHTVELLKAEQKRKTP